MVPGIPVVGALGWLVPPLFVVKVETGTVRNAASCRPGDIQAAIDAADTGFTVIVPAGEAERKLGAQ